MSFIEQVSYQAIEKNTKNSVIPTIKEKELNISFIIVNGDDGNVAQAVGRYLVSQTNGNGTTRLARADAIDLDNLDDATAETDSGTFRFNNSDFKSNVAFTKKIQANTSLELKKIFSNITCVFDSNTGGVETNNSIAHGSDLNRTNSVPNDKFTGLFRNMDTENFFKLNPDAIKFNNGKVQINVENYFLTSVTADINYLLRLQNEINIAKVDTPHFGVKEVNANVRILIFVTSAAEEVVIVNDRPINKAEFEAKYNYVTGRDTTKLDFPFTYLNNTTVNAASIFATLFNELINLNKACYKNSGKLIYSDVEYEDKNGNSLNEMHKIGNHEVSYGLVLAEAIKDTTYNKIMDTAVPETPSGNRYRYVNEGFVIKIYDTVEKIDGKEKLLDSINVAVVEKDQNKIKEHWNKTCIAIFGNHGNDPSIKNSQCRRHYENVITRNGLNILRNFSEDNPLGKGTFANMGQIKDKVTSANPAIQLEIMRALKWQANAKTNKLLTVKEYLEKADKPIKEYLDTKHELQELLDGIVENINKYPEVLGTKLVTKPTDSKIQENKRQILSSSGLIRTISPYSERFTVHTPNGYFLQGGAADVNKQYFSLQNAYKKALESLQRANQKLSSNSENQFQKKLEEFKKMEDYLNKQVDVINTYNKALRNKELPPSKYEMTQEQLDEIIKNYESTNKKMKKKRTTIEQGLGKIYIYTEDPNDNDTEKEPKEYTFYI